MRKLLLAFMTASVAAMFASPALATARIDPGRHAAHSAVYDATTAHRSIAPGAGTIIALGERGDRPADGTIAVITCIDSANAGLAIST